MARVFLGLGGNIGDPAKAMREALAVLDRAPRTAVVRASSLYRTPPWGKIDQPDFLNAVAEIQTDLTPRELLELCLQTERGLKRVRAERWGPRVIDMDILWFDGETIEEEGLQIPHPRLEERAFVLVPLAEIAPDLPLRSGRAAEVAETLDTDEIVRMDAKLGF